MAQAPELDLAALFEPHAGRLRDLCVTVAWLRGEDGAMGALGEAPEGVDGADLMYEIGSVTKVFTSLLLAELVVEGRLSLDDPIGPLLPPDVLGDSRLGREVTLRHLATHTSGLPRLPGNLRVLPWTLANPYARYTTANLYAFLRSFQPKETPPAEAVYSNLGVGLLGHLLARTLDTTYEEAVRERVCGPMGLRDTTIGLTDEQRRRLVPGHSASGQPAGLWDLPSLAGAGGLRSTARDMARFLSACLGRLATPLGPALARTLEPQASIGEGRSAGLGWVIEERGDTQWIWHNGATGGYSAYVGFCAPAGVAVCVLANHTVPATGGAQAVADAMGRALAERLLPPP